MGCVPAPLLPDLLRLRAARAEAASDEDPEAPHREVELAERIVRQQEAAAPLTLAQLAVDGDDLRETLGLPEGPIIGTILERLLADVIEDPALNSRVTLLARASLILDRQLGAGGRSGGPVTPGIG
jgi:hypothetical protein